MTQNGYSTPVKTQSKIENISLVPEPQRSNIRNLVSLADEIFIKTKLAGSQLHELFYDCVEGQIILSLMPIKRKERKYLSIYDFHIGDDIRHKVDDEIYDVHDVILDLYREFFPITKFKKSNYKVGDKVTVAKVFGFKSIGYKLVTKEARIIGIGVMNISRPDDVTADVLIEDDISPTHVSQGAPHTIFWRLA